MFFEYLDCLDENPAAKRKWRGRIEIYNLRALIMTEPKGMSTYFLPKDDYSLFEI